MPFEAIRDQELNPLLVDAEVMGRIDRGKASGAFSSKHPKLLLILDGQTDQETAFTVGHEVGHATGGSRGGWNAEVRLWLSTDPAFRPANARVNRLLQLLSVDRRMGTGFYWRQIDLWEPQPK